MTWLWIVGGAALYLGGGALFAYSVGRVVKAWLAPFALVWPIATLILAAEWIAERAQRGPPA